MKYQSWWLRYIDQLKFVHMAGDSSSILTGDWVIPLATDAAFADIMVNRVEPPTFNRHLYGGDR